MIWEYYIIGMLFFLIINLYVPFGIPFDSKRYYKDGSHTNVAEAKIWHHYQLLIRDTHGSNTRFRSTLRRLGVDLAVRLRMVYSREGQQVFVSHAWRILFGIRAPLVREFILEFLSTCRMSDTEMGLDVANMLCFQLGGVRRRMMWRQFILALGLHTKQEMAEAGFGAYRDYWIEISFDRDFLGLAPSYVLIRDPMRRSCHRMIAYNIFGRGQAPEKVTGVDLFYLRSMDRGTTNVPHLLAQYMFKHIEGMKSRARLSGGHFIGRLAMHFGLVSDEGLRGLQVVTRELPLIDLHKLGRLSIYTRYSDTCAWVAQGPERQHAAAAGTHEADEAGPAAEEGAQEIPVPTPAPTQSPPLAP
ncbi:hypothetical protein Tco_1478202 [Tanacetum coccineum]